MRRGGGGLLVLSDCWGSIASRGRSRGRPASDARRPRRKPGPPTSRPCVLAQALIIPRLHGRSPGLRSDDALMYARTAGTPTLDPRSGFDLCPRGRRQLYLRSCYLCSRDRSQVVVGVCFIVSVMPRVVTSGAQLSGDTVAAPPDIYELRFTSVAGRRGSRRSIGAGRCLRDGLRPLACHASCRLVAARLARLPHFAAMQVETSLPAIDGSERDICALCWWARRRGAPARRVS